MYLVELLTLYTYQKLSNRLGTNQPDLIFIYVLYVTGLEHVFKISQVMFIR